MSKLSFFPFEVRRGELPIRVELVGVEVQSDAAGRIHAYSVDQEMLTLRVTVGIDPSILEGTLANEERNAPPIEALLILKSISGKTRLRKHIAQTVGEHQIEVQLWKQDWLGALEARAVLVRSRSNHGLPAGLARDQGALLADSAVVEILFDELPAPPVGGLIVTKWDNFSESAKDYLKRQPGSLFALDDVVDPPILYLNSGLTGATATLQSTGTTGVRAHIRELTYALIAHHVWPTLLTRAFNALCDKLRDSVDEQAWEELLPWHQATLKEWAPRLYHDRHRDAALSELCKTLGHDDWERDLLQVRLPYALQSYLKTGHKFTQAAKEL